MTGKLPQILVVDDDNRNQKIMLEILEDLYRVDLADSGESCLESVAKRAPDLFCSIL